MSNKFNIAIVGATGNVGREILHILVQRNFPSDNIYQTSNIKRKSQYFVNYTSTWDVQPAFSIENGIKNIFKQVDTTYGPFIGRSYYIKCNYIIK